MYGERNASDKLVEKLVEDLQKRHTNIMSTKYFYLSRVVLRIQITEKLKIAFLLGESCMAFHLRCLCFWGNDKMVRKLPFYNSSLNLLYIVFVLNILSNVYFQPPQIMTKTTSSGANSYLQLSCSKKKNTNLIEHFEVQVDFLLYKNVGKQQYSDNLACATLDIHSKHVNPGRVVNKA